MMLFYFYFIEFQVQHNQQEQTKKPSGQKVEKTATSTTVSDDSGINIGNWFQQANGS